MTREQIEKAAKETLVNEPVEIQATKVGAFQRGFVAGAEWRINSMWHPTNELPQHSGYLAVSMGNGLTEVIHYTAGIGFHEMALKGYTLWAYVSDLIPERKEGTK